MTGSQPTAVHSCGFCGAEFEEDRGQPTCEACPLSKACGFVRCPECGYENPRSPGWLDRVKEWLRP
jgi:rubredoxin